MRFSGSIVRHDRTRSFAWSDRSCQTPSGKETADSQLSSSAKPCIVTDVRRSSASSSEYADSERDSRRIRCGRPSNAVSSVSAAKGSVPESMM